ncbi:MAG: hypothetical protein ABGX27_05105 [Desulfurobacteriaceae bacterium]
MDRRMEALKILKKYRNQDYYYLGEGFSGVVFHDNRSVYKVHIPLANNSYGESDGLLYLREKLDVFKNSKYFYEVDLFKIDDIYILRY